MGAAWVLLATGWAATAPEVPYRFQVPEGWTDLSPAAPPENFSRAPQGLAGLARTGQYAAVAADLAGASPTFVANFNAVVGVGGLRFDPGVVDALAASLLKDAAATPGGHFEVKDKRVVQIGGVNCGRIAAEVERDGVRAIQVFFYLPGGDRLAVLTFSSGPDAFARYEPVFDAAARATAGVREGPAPRNPADAALPYVTIPALIGLAAVLPVLLFLGIRKLRARTGTP